ncbi:MAG: type II toxin-antitoxin system RelE/ParE family toxin [Methanospirillum sp.]
MGYDIELTEDAEHTLRKLTKSNREMARRINRELGALGAEDNPRRFVSQLNGHYPPYYSLHVGDFRVIMRIYDDRLVIVVVDLGPRKTIYRDY